MKRLFLIVLLVMLAIPLFGCGESLPSASVSSGRDAPAVQGTRVTCIDVGKGDCILVQAGSSAVLIDTGYQSTAGEVLEVLHEQGVGHLDATILTHYDRDHVSGLAAIAEVLTPGTVYLPGYAGSDKNYKSTMETVDDLGLAAQRVTTEVQLALGEGRLTIYPSSVAYVPGAGGDEGNDNDASLVVTLTCGDDSYLFAGDLEKEGIEAYLRAGYGGFDVIKMPHHGEGEGNTDVLIDDVQPSIALITDSTDDPADKKVLKLLKKQGGDTYRTSECGTIVIESNGTGAYEVSTSS